MTAELVGTDGAHLSWTDSTDNVGVTDYVVNRSDGTTTTAADVGLTTTFDESGLAEATTYTYSVVAYDAALNESPASNDGPVSTADPTPPSKPAGLTATQGVSSSIHLSWTPATDNLAVTDYIVTRDDGMTFDAGAVASYDDVGVVVGTTYSYTVVAYDGAQSLDFPGTEKL